jgi:DNA-binding protein Fis
MHNSPVDENPTSLNSANRNCGLERSGSGQTQMNVLDVLQLLRELLGTSSPRLYRRLILEVDRAVVRETLRHVGGNQVLASKLLGMSRTTFRAKLKQVIGSRTASILETGSGDDSSVRMVAVSDRELSGDWSPTAVEEVLHCCQEGEADLREPGTLGVTREK